MARKRRKKGQKKQKLRAIGYIRISRAKRGEDASLPAQRALIERWCKDHKYQLVRIYSGGAISTRKRQPQREKAIAEACELQAALIVYSLSRLARSVIDACRVTRQLVEAGAQLISLTETFDTSNSSGKLVFHVMASVSEWERDAISERTSAALRAKVARGEWTGRPPYGWRVGAKIGQLVPDLEEQRILSLVCDLYDRGYSYRTLEELLPAMGIPPLRGNKRWYRATIRRILQEGVHLSGPLRRIPPEQLEGITE